MSDLMIARSSGSVTIDGERFTIRSGRTVADADHEIVKRHPKAWVPVVASYGVDAPATDAELREEVAELHSLIEGYVETLEAIAEGLAERGYAVPVEEDREPGWLTTLVLNLIGPAPEAANEASSDPSDVVDPPRPPARKRVPPKAE